MNVGPPCVKWGDPKAPQGTEDSVGDGHGSCGDIRSRRRGGGYGKEEGLTGASEPPQNRQHHQDHYDHDQDDQDDQDDQEDGQASL